MSSKALKLLTPPYPFPNIRARVRLKLLVNWIAYVAARAIFRCVFGKRLRDRVFAKLFAKLRYWWNFVMKAGKGIWTGPLSEARVYCSDFSEYAFFHHNEEIFLKATFTPEPGQVVVDIGAHQGLWTLYAARRVKPEGLVIAVEPHPLNVEKLLKNLRLNNFSNVIVKQIALGSSNGETALYESRDQGSHSVIRPVQPTGRTITVRLRKLDSLLAEEFKVQRIDWIKIDVEGAEYDVLTGPMELLRRWKPKLVIEIHGSDNLQRVTQLLADVGYRIKVLREDPHWGERSWVLAIRER